MSMYTACIDMCYIIYVIHMYMHVHVHVRNIVCTVSIMHSQLSAKSRAKTVAPAVAPETCTCLSGYTGTYTYIIAPIIQGHGLIYPRLQEVFVKRMWMSVRRTLTCALTLSLTVSTLSEDTSVAVEPVTRETARTAKVRFMNIQRCTHTHTHTHTHTIVRTCMYLERVSLDNL